MDKVNSKKDNSCDYNFIHEKHRTSEICKNCRFLTMSRILHYRNIERKIRSEFKESCNKIDPQKSFQPLNI